jgi:hypothetical protein
LPAYGSHLTRNETQNFDKIRTEQLVRTTLPAINLRTS